MQLCGNEISEIVCHLPWIIPSIDSWDAVDIFSSAVPPGSGAFQMPTHPSSSSALASTLRGGRANLRNASVTFSLFSSAVPSGSGAFQMPTRPSSSSSASSAVASTLRGEGPISETLQ